MILQKLLFQRKLVCKYANTVIINSYVWVSSNTSNIFKFSDLKVELASHQQLHSRPNQSNVQFGKYFTDHMFRVHYYEESGGWQKPEIIPRTNIVLHPAAKVLHYALQAYEEMKAYRGTEGKVRLFRPELYLWQLNENARRVSLPTFDSKELIKCLNKLINIDQEWMSHSESSSLYVRITLIGTEPKVGVNASSSATLFVILCPMDSHTMNNAISLLVDPNYTRAWPGGCGDRKMGSNYIAMVRAQEEASRKGCHEVLSLYGKDNLITQTNTMNVFIVCVNKDGDRELLTPILDGTIISGVIRRSILELSENWCKLKVSERSISLNEIIQLLNENRLLEMFCCGTENLIIPVERMHYMNTNFKIPTMEQTEPVFLAMKKSLTDIQFGHVKHPWVLDIDKYF